MTNIAQQRRGLLGTARALWRSSHHFAVTLAIARKTIDEIIATSDTWSDLESFKQCSETVRSSQHEFKARLDAYNAYAEIVERLVKIAVDQSAETTGWDALLKLSRSPDELWTALCAANTYASKLDALAQALKEIDAGNGKVQDENFTNLSTQVRHWWDLLRPNETSYFEGIQRRSPKARRTIDLKASLALQPDKSDAKSRDAVAVFSQSQLHCLGLSLFLARAVKEDCGFIVLDDPVLTSDDDYRPHFTSSILEGLMDNGLQVIMATQDYKSWKDIGDRWSHRGASQFQLVWGENGTVIRSDNDDITAALTKLRPFVASDDPYVRKSGGQHLRECIERFGKMIVTKDRWASGDLIASITDYDGKNFGDYKDKVFALLKKDPSHIGKLKSAYSSVTPAPHDDTPPSKAALKQAYGDLKALVKTYS